MRFLTPVTVLVVFLVGVSMILAGFASTLALARGNLELLHADLRAQIEADYGADPQVDLAPLDPRLIEDARSDESQLQSPASGSDVELVQVYHVPGSGGASVDGGEPPAAVAAPGSTATATPAPGSSPAPGTSPEPGGSDPDSPDSPDSTATPGPGPAPAPTPTPAPGTGTTPLSSTPTPTNTVVPTPTPTPTPPPSTTTVAYYLHNNPTPPYADTFAQTLLPMNTTVPTASTLYNYDKNLDAQPGRTITRGGSGPNESDVAKRQRWLGPSLSSTITIKGSPRVNLWSGVKSFQTGIRGSVTAYLYDFDGSSYTLIGQATRDVPTWQNGVNGWVQHQITLPSVNYTMAAGHALDLRIIVDSTSADDMWFAYDTTAYKSSLTVTIQ